MGLRCWCYFVWLVLVFDKKWGIKVPSWRLKPCIHTFLHSGSLLLFFYFFSNVLFWQVFLKKNCITWWLNGLGDQNCAPIICSDLKIAFETYFCIMLQHKLFQCCLFKAFDTVESRLWTHLLRGTEGCLRTFDTVTEVYRNVYYRL